MPTSSGLYKDRQQAREQESTSIVAMRTMMMITVRNRGLSQVKRRLVGPRVSV